MRKWNSFVLFFLFFQFNHIGIVLAISPKSPDIWGSIDRGKVDEVEYYLKKDKYILNSENKHYGYTPLIWAVMCGHENIVGQLLSRGANPYASDHMGRTAYSVAEQKGFKNIAALIRKKLDYNPHDFLSAEDFYKYTRAITPPEFKTKIGGFWADRGKYNVDYKNNIKDKYEWFLYFADSKVDIKLPEEKEAYWNGFKTNFIRGNKASALKLQSKDGKYTLILLTEPPYSKDELQKVVRQFPLKELN